MRVILKCKEFGKFTIDACYFKRLLDNCVLHFRGHVGFLHSLSTNEMGPFERFYLGGTSSVLTKLLEVDFVPLHGYPDDSLTTEDYMRMVKGGFLFNKFVSELRFSFILTSICNIDFQYKNKIKW